MFERKLANSIQQDYRQTADQHRLIKENRINRQPAIRLATVTPIIIAIALVILFI